MPPKLRAVTVLACLAAATLAACRDDALRPGEGVRPYRLFTYDGRALPARIVASGTDTTYVDGRFIYLLVNGLAVRNTQWRMVHAGAQASTSFVVDTLPYHEEADGRITIGPRYCTPSASCVAADTGRVSIDRLLLAQISDGSAPVWEYVRLIPID
jgi:hypothetical protein